MKQIKVALSALAATSLLCSCASTPMGPTVQVMPGPTVPFQVFQQNQEECKQYAQTQVAGQADRANTQAVGVAALGTALGAVVGAATSWHGNAAGEGAGVGAAAGTAAGAGTSAEAQGSIQQQYDNAYVQCMYAKGNQVPGGAPAPAADAPPPPAAGPGMTVAEAQEKLNDLGFAVGAPDGHIGARTRQALSNFQQSHGLPPTGALDPATMQALSE